MHIERTNFLDLHFDRLSFAGVKRRLRAVTNTSAYGYVVTPNVDQVVRLHREPSLRPNWEKADICVCDSQVLRLLAKLRGISLKLVRGSDLCSALFHEIIKPGDAVAVVGATRACIDGLRADFPDVEIIHHEPPMGLRSKPAARTAAAKFVAASNARFALIAVGSPQQEMIANEVRRQSGATGIALCIGAGLDFVTGKQRRAPKALQAVGLEWAFRLTTNPRRLWKRYLVEGIRIFPIYLRWRPHSSAPLVVLLVGVAALVGGAIYSATAGGFWKSSAGSSMSTSTPLPPSSVANIKLPPPDLLKPLSPEEAEKQNAERPFVDRPDNPAGRFVLKAGGDDRDRALECLTQAVYYEAAGEGADGGRAVAQVVLNRMRHPGYPASICGVVYQGSERTTGCQFTFTCDGSLMRAPVEALWARSRKIAEEALNGKVFAKVGHATHYHADYVLPYWADSLDKTVQIGRHIFYRLRGNYGDSRAFSQRYAGVEPASRAPGGSVVLPLTEEAEELANRLVSDDVIGKTPEVERAPLAESHLAIDDTPGSLLIDGQAAPPNKGPSKKTISDCSVTGDSKRLSPLGANDVRSSASGSRC